MSNALHPFGRVDFHSPLLPDSGLSFDCFDMVVQTRRLSEIPACFERLEAALRSGFHAFGFVAYEAAPAFDSALRTRPPGELPLLWFGLAKSPVPAAPPADPGPFSFGEWQPAWGQAEYEQAFARVKQHIRDGDTYQLNLTFPLRAAFAGDAAGCYARLRAAQAANCCAFIQTPDWAVLSASPEFFFERRGKQMHTRPMKGTRRRGLTLQTDLAIARELRSSPKDRAENVMIVDLLRNDLGRIAVPGSVRVPDLFTLEKYPTLWQMTSTVTATPRPGLSLYEIFQALFPCGSVTGAPKVKTMELIAATEAAPRGVYCGSVGYIAPNGDCVFNVAIRTVTVIGNRAEYPVGSGVVADSSGEDEYEECLLKAKVLEAAPLADLELLETMRWTPDEGYYLEARHLERLADSAAYFDFKLDAKELSETLAEAAAAWAGPMRVRLLLAKSGAVRLEGTPIPPPPAKPEKRRVRLAAQAVNSGDVFLYHKTTCRTVYEEASAQRGAADDVLLYNERGELTESTIANVTVLLDGVWVTPPVACGLLGGTMRAELLCQGEIHERVIHLEDLRHAGGIRLLNSVRGIFEVELLE